METKPVEIFSEASNLAIVRVPGRRFPGCVVQGDSLSILLGNAKEVWERVKDSSDGDLLRAAQALVESLQSRLDHYERVLTEHGIQLPYSK
jgi:predicted RNase H-like HicB family nuclease